MLFILLIYFNVTFDVFNESSLCSSLLEGSAQKRFGIDGDREAVPLKLEVLYNKVRSYEQTKSLAQLRRQECSWKRCQMCACGSFRVEEHCGVCVCLVAGLSSLTWPS